MLKTWTKILPFFLVEWLAKRKLARFRLYDRMDSVNPYKGVYIEVSDDV